jgi:aminoglycoside 3-N-acetyltransferase
MKHISRSELEDALYAVGVNRGCLLHVQSALKRIGPVEGGSTRKGILEFYLETISNLIGSEGTLTVLTATMSCGYYGKPFVHEATPSEVGVFSEHVRCQPLAVRSLHPIMSLSSLGAMASEICGRPHFNAYGIHSPWNFLEEKNAVICTLGLGLDNGGGGATYFHYLESRYGVPYQYRKQLSIPVFRNGSEITGVFTMDVRYLDFGIEYNTVSFKERLYREGIASMVPIGGASIWAAPAKLIMKRGAELLDEDRFMLLKAPPEFRVGEIPMDGASVRR